MRRLLVTVAVIVLITVYSSAQIPVGHCMIQDWSAGTNGVSPSSTVITNSTFGATISSQSGAGGSNIATTTSAHFNPWVGVTPTCVSAWSNNSTLGLTYTYTASAVNNTISVIFAGGPSNTASLSVPFQTTMAQAANPPSFSDVIDIGTVGGFVNFQFGDNGTHNGLAWFMECGGCAGGGSGSVDRTVPSNTWVIINEFKTPTQSFIGFWDSSTGLFKPNSLATATSPTQQPDQYYVGVGTGPAGMNPATALFGTVMECGIVANETTCPFPLAPGLQRLSPTLSVVGGAYATPQSGITLTDLDGLGSIYYTLDGSIPSCTLGTNDVIVSCNGTLFSGSIPTIYITTTVKAIDCLSNYQCSPVTSATYTITPGAGILATARAIDWTNVGAVPGQPGYLPDVAWTQSGSTIAAYGTSGSPGNTSTIQTAVTACSGGKYVLLGSGTFHLTGNPINIGSNCELRGAGASLTLIIYHGSGSGGSCLSGGYFICAQGSSNFANGEQNHATWTAGFAQGATTLTLSNTLNIVAGQTIIGIDQQDETADTGNIWNCLTTTCGAANSGGGARTDNTCAAGVSPNNGFCSQQQWVLVTACGTCNSAGSSTVTISPGLAMPNWASAKSTGAWWATTVAQQPGIRDLSLDMTSASVQTSPILLANAYQPFVFQVRTVFGSRNHIGLQYTKNATVMSNYAYSDSQTGTSSYAIEVFDSSDALITNNICQQVVECVVQTGGGTGDVGACNFSVSSDSNATAFLTQMDFAHASGDSFFLTECEFSSGMQHDQTHGTHHFFFDYRNGLTGWFPASSCNGSACTTNTVADFIYGGSRYGSVIGNLVGQSGYHTVSGTLYYPSIAGAQCGNPSWKTIFMVGCGAAGATFCANPASCGGGTAVFDALTINSLVLYKNYDVITGASCTGTNTPTAGCVGFTANSFNDSTGSPSTYIGLASPGTLPPSMVFSSAPIFFGTVPFPPIGPDVTSGNLLLCTSGTYNGSYVISGGQCAGGTSSQAFGGHANAIPAMACYLNSMIGPPDGTGAVLTFNPSSCYGTSVPANQPSPAPSGAIFAMTKF